MSGRVCAPFFLVLKNCGKKGGNAGKKPCLSFQTSVSNDLENHAANRAASGCSIFAQLPLIASPIE